VSLNRNDVFVIALRDVRCGAYLEKLNFIVAFNLLESSKRSGVTWAFSKDNNETISLF
jgi:hypothetical protein